MKAFVDYILQFGQLNQQQIDLIMQHSTELTLPKDAYYLEAGKVSKQFGFVREGVSAD